MTRRSSRNNPLRDIRERMLIVRSGFGTLNWMDVWTSRLPRRHSRHRDCRKGFIGDAGSSRVALRHPVPRYEMNGALWREVLPFR